MGFFVFYVVIFIMNFSYILILLIAVGIFLISRGNSNIPKISSEEGLGLLNDKDYKFLDVRTDSEHSNGHIPNSFHIPLQELQSRISEIEPMKDKNIIVYCRSGARSRTVTKTLLKNGFKVFNLSGGIMSWKGKLKN